MSAALPSLAEDLALLIDAADEAGQIARHYWRQHPKVWDKGGSLGPVSEADLAVNDALHGALIGARPGYGWLSEESPDDRARLAALRGFILDPIDGTRAFIDGQEGFSHAIAVVEGGQVVAAVVHLPVLGLTYTATADGPAQLNGADIAPSHHALIGAQVLTSKAAMSGAHWRGGAAPGFSRVFRPSLAWRLCLAAQGRFDAALSLNLTWEWDIAAASLIAARAGAAVTDRHGAHMRFNNPEPQIDGLIVAGEPLHGALLSALAPMQRGR